MSEIRLDRSNTILYEMAYQACLRLYPEYFDVVDHRNMMAAIVKAARNSIRKGEIRHGNRTNAA